MSLSIATAVDAQDRPRLLGELAACAAIPAADQRLACYDRAAPEFDRAERAGEIVVTDRQRLEEVRRRGFGLNIDALGALMGTPSDRLAAIESEIASVQRQPRGEWIFTLADGSVWFQTDATRLPGPPRAGQSVVVREAAMGSYLLSVGGARSVRVRRER